MENSSNIAVVPDNDTALHDATRTEPDRHAIKSPLHEPEAPKSSFIRKTIYLPLCFLAYMILDVSFRYTYCKIFSQTGALFTSWRNYMPLCFSLGWSLLFCAVIALLPRIGKRIFLGITVIFNIVLCLVHSVMFNIFQKFFSFADIGFADDGFAFLEKEYINIPKKLIIGIITALALAVAAFILAPKERMSVKRLISGVAALILGIGTIIGIRSSIPSPNENFSWDDYYDTNAFYAIYTSFNEPKKALTLCGLYQYTFRDIYKATGIFDRISNGEYYEEIDKYFSEKETSTNEYTGLLEGKNLIMVQLESIDSWMLTKEYMPNLYSVMEQSVNFDNYFSSVFIAAGTFNAEFTSQTGIIPASGTVSQSVYTENNYSLGLPALFRNAGYKANSFHGSEADVYNRGNIHQNLGFEKYYSGNDMEMSNYQMDRYLMSGYDLFTGDDPFYSFIITFSGHGPYEATSLNTTEHIEDATRLVAENLTFDIDEKDLENYRYAIAHAQETDMFVGELFDKLNEDGHIDDTVVIFYTDHYNYYYGNDNLITIFKNVPDTTMAQRVPFFIYSKELEPQTVSKPCSGIDILPTVANLFGLDTDLSMYVGDDIFGDGGGHVPFKGNGWYDGDMYYIPGVTTKKSEHIASLNKAVSDEINISGSILKCDYYEYAAKNKE